MELAGWLNTWKRGNPEKPEYSGLLYVGGTWKEDDQAHLLAAVLAEAFLCFRCFWQCKLAFILNGFTLFLWIDLKVMSVPSLPFTVFLVYMV